MPDRRTWLRRHGLPRPVAAALALSVAVALTALATGCSGQQASATERAVCGDLQEMVDALAAGKSPEAVGAYDHLVGVANDSTEASPILTQARRMASITDATVDEATLPMSEVADLAREAMTSSGDALALLASACDSAGVPIERMDSAAATS